MNPRDEAFQAENLRRQALRTHAEAMVQEMDDCKGLREFLLSQPTWQSLSLVQFDGLNGHRIRSRISLTAWKGMPHWEEIAAYRNLLLVTLNRWERALNLPETQASEIPPWPEAPPEEVLIA